MRFAGSSDPLITSGAVGHFVIARAPARIAAPYDDASCLLRPAMSCGLAVSLGAIVAGLPPVSPGVTATVGALADAAAALVAVDAPLAGFAATSPAAACVVSSGVGACVASFAAPHEASATANRANGITAAERSSMDMVNLNRKKGGIADR